jgi:mono/diheme cytochrome c family protein
MNRLIIAAILLACGPALADEAAPLAPGAAQSTVSANCSACHTSDYIIMNSHFLSADSWKAEVTKMRKAFGAPIDDETATEIANYLAANYAAEPKK